MPIVVEIHEPILAKINGWGLPRELTDRMLVELTSTLETRRTDQLGDLYSVAPVRLWKLVVAIPDNDRIHSFVFLVNSCKHRRIVMEADHRTSREFP